MTSQLFNNPLLFNAPDEGSVKIMFHVLCTQTRVPRDNSALLLDSAVVSTHYTSVKDGQTDAQTPYHSIYSAMHASRGKKNIQTVQRYYCYIGSDNEDSFHTNDIK